MKVKTLISSEDLATTLVRNSLVVLPNKCSFTPNKPARFTAMQVQGDQISLSLTSKSIVVLEIQ